MKIRMQVCAAAVLAFLVFCLQSGAATHYVVPPGTAGAAPAESYTSWATAGTSIIDVVNTAMTNSAPRMVWVTNGTYYPTNMIFVTNALTLRSLNGRDVTILNGSSTGPAGFYTNRCASFYNYYTTDPSVFDGFTVSNYYVRVVNGHGTVGSSGNLILSVLNCTFVNNTNWPTATYGSGGGVYLTKSGGTITNCIFRRNYANINGGAIMAQQVTGSLAISGCTIENNSAYQQGGGISVYMIPGGGRAVISNCVISNNSCSLQNNYGFTGGGLSLAGTNQNILIANCTIISNKTIYTIGAATSPFGSGVAGNECILRNCLVVQNSGASNGGGVYISSNAFIESCTIASNSAKGLGGGVYITGVNVTGINNIVYYNTAPDGGANFTNLTGNTGLNYCCVIPAVDGTANITNDPMMVNFAGGNYWLKANSPCVNKGTNQSWMAGAFDLGGKQRIRYGWVDMGCYEKIYGGTIYGFR